jgi:ADP-heptose:LPS heptosyltransferase
MQINWRKYSMGMWPKEILIVQLDGLGEIYLSKTLFEDIKKLFPDSKVTLLCTSGGRLLSPCVDKVLELSPPKFILNQHKRKGFLRDWIDLFKKIIFLRKKKYDLIIDLKRYSHEILLTSLLRGRRKIDYFQIKRWENARKLPPWKKIYVIDERYKILSLSLGKEIEPRYLLNNKNSRGEKTILSPFTSNPEKDIPLVLIKNIIKKNYDKKIVLVGSREDIPKSQELIGFPNVINLVGKTSLEELEKLIKSGRKVISADTISAHIAFMNGVPQDLYINKEIFYKKRFKPRKKCRIIRMK